MARKLEFFFDFVSPFSYIAFHALPHYLEGVEAEVEYRPMFLGAVMQGTGNRPPGMVPAKARYMTRDLERCSARYGITQRMHPDFPMLNTRPWLRAAIGLADTPQDQKTFIAAVLHGVWAAPDPLRADDPEAMRALCQANGLDADRIEALMQDENLKDRLRANTDDAMARGAFGAPSFFVGDELFFGHDRLDYAVEALEAR